MEKLREIAEWFANWNITLYYVGGSVRDEVMGLPVEDYDICIVGGETAGNIQGKFEILLQFGQIRGFTPVFNDFPIWIVDIDGDKFEFAMARTERKTGQSHQDFLTEVKNVTIEEDLKRRDFTINAIAENVLTGEIIDPYEGRFDIEQKVLAPVSESFKEDPLRVYRAARFYARFNFTPSWKLILFCKTLLPDGISKERVGIEMMKMMKTAQVPSNFFYFLKTIGWLQYHFKELHDCIGVPQSPVHHPEGCVYTHLMHCIDAVPMGDWFMRTVMLCHDLGKATETVLKNEHHELNWADIKNSMTLADRIDISAFKITSVGHEEAGVQLTYKMLQRISFTDHKTIRKIGCLVKLHMLRATINQKNYDKMVRRTLRELMHYGLGYDDLMRVIMYDLSGRPPIAAPTIGTITRELYWEYCLKLIHNNEMEPIVTGELLLSLGLKPSPEIGKIVHKALEFQDRGTLKKDNWYNVLKGTFPQLFKKLENERISDSSTSECGKAEESTGGDDTGGIRKAS